LQTLLPIASLWDRLLRLLANGGAGLEWWAVGALSAWEAGGPNRHRSGSERWRFVAFCDVLVGESAFGFDTSTVLFASVLAARRAFVADGDRGDIEFATMSSTDWSVSSGRYHSAR
jgi:hypothetical protein